MSSELGVLRIQKACSRAGSPGHWNSMPRSAGSGSPWFLTSLAVTVVAPASVVPGCRVTSVPSETSSLTQVVAWDLALTDELRTDVRSVAEAVQFGSLRLMEREGSADLVLHYSFPAGTLAGDALREFVLFVLAQGVDARRRLVG